MVYAGTYTATDTSEIIIDIVVGVLVALVGFGALIGLVMLFKWFKGKIK